ncbi:hypothetical protein CK203_095503 [Vitis vinifera]|uniref:Uncharacterized protein n=1 Tax=Vitis vinifera TaxID=29760 RepID=A0A438CJD7_VITVI|nr:hypothetical protein CK203_095503 [Vitis vinifera]
MGERERESEREREGERERESACDGDDEETGEASRRRSFTVESKTFDLPWMIGKGNAKGRWEKEWKEGGKLYTLARGFNRAGVYLRLGVVGLERKRFCIFLPRGRRGKRGWTAMVEMVRQMEEMAGRRTEVQEVRTVGKANPAKSYIEAVRRTNWDGLNAIKMRLQGRRLLATYRSWSIPRRKALLEFEDLSEARRVASSGSRLLGGAHLGLELWNPKTGCRVEEEMEQIAWVRIYGLPISLWSPGTLKKIGEECGGFVDMDERTRSMGRFNGLGFWLKQKAISDRAC